MSTIAPPMAPPAMAPTFGLLLAVSPPVRADALCLVKKLQSDGFEPRYAGIRSSDGQMPSLHGSELQQPQNVGFVVLQE